MLKFKVMFATSILAIFAMFLVASSINEKQAQKEQLAKAPSHQGITNPSFSEEWEKFYPREYSSWKQTINSETITDTIKEKPFYAIAYAGYSFLREFNTPRGHMFAAQDQINSLKIAGAEDKVPALCWTCHSGSVPELIKRDGEMEFYSKKWVDYGPEVLNPIGCNNCHDDKTMKLDVKLPHFHNGLKVAGMKSFEDASFQEKRSMVCMQCHTEFYVKKEKFKDANGTEKTAALIHLPYKYGTQEKDIKKLYDELNIVKYTNPISKTPMIKTVHTYYENWQNGTHAKNGVSCADCHMPYTREGVVKYTDHKIQSPLNTIQTSCLNCHKQGEQALKDTIKAKKERFTFIADMAFENFAKVHLEIAKALEVGASDEELKEVRQMIKDAQFKADIPLADHGSYFHASEDVLKALGEANDIAQQARIKLVGILAKHGVMDYVLPDYDTKDKAQKLAGLDFAKVIEAKIKFKETLEAEWKRVALEKGYIAPNSVALDPALNKKPSYYKDVNR